MRILDVTTGKELVVFKGHKEDVTSVAFSLDSNTLASGSRDDTVRLWDIATGKEMAVFKGHKKNIISLAFSPDGKKLASASFDYFYPEDSTVRLWDITTNKELAVLRNDKYQIINVAFSSDGIIYGMTQTGSIVRLWDVRPYVFFLQEGQSTPLYRHCH